MKRKRMKSMAALAMAVAVAAGALSGCGTAKRGSMADGNAPGQQKETENAGNTGKSQGPAAMGRYVENEVSLPQEAKEERFVSLFYGEGDVLELYTASGADAAGTDGVRRFLREGDGWRQDEGWWERVKPKGVSAEIRRVFYGLDGNYYYTAMTAEGGYVCHLYQVGEAGNVELIPEAFQAEPGRDYGFIPTKVEVGKDGNILLHGFHDCLYYQPDGKRLFSMEKADSASSEKSVGYLTDTEFVTQVEGGVARYSLEDGKRIETIPYEEQASALEETMVLFGDKSGGIYAATERGLAHVNPKGSLWELLIDGSLNTMGMRSMYLEAFLAGDEEDYYAAFVTQGGKGILLCRYTYDANASAVPPAILTVYGLEDNSTVRQAAALFQKSHPEVRVEVLNGANQDGNVSEDTIRALNTELLGGRGADVLILDGLPAKAYQKKGVLMDLREVFGTIQKESPIMGQVLSGFTEEDGGIYQMPARIMVPVAMGTEEALNALKSLDGMKNYEGGAPLIYTTTYENLLRMVASISCNEILGSDGAWTEEMLVKYLETVKALAEKNHAKEMFTEEEMEKLHTGNRVAPYGIVGTEMNFDQGLSGCGMENLDGMFQTIIFEAVLEKHPEAVRKDINGIYFPKTLVGVNQNTKQPELAREFVRQMFSTEVQKEELYDGFPVGLKAQQINCATDRAEISMGSGYEGYHISGSWPDLEKRKEIYQLIGTVSTPVMVDETVMRMIADGAAGYLDGKTSAVYAAGEIWRQVMLYQAEQE